MGTINQSYFNRVKYTLSHPETGSLVIDEPIGWNNDEKEFARNEEYHGIFTNFSNNLKFIESGADFILLIDELYGINAQLRLTKDERHPKTDLWVRSYDGYLDLSTKEEEDGQVSVKFNSGGLEQLLKARESEQVEVDRSTSIEGNTLDPLSINEISLQGRRVFLKTDWESKGGTEAYCKVGDESDAGASGSGSAGVPMKIINKSHEEAQDILQDSGYSLRNVSSGTPKGAAGMMFFAVSDKDRILNINIDLSFSFVVDQKDVDWAYFGINLTKYKNGVAFDVIERFPFFELKNKDEIFNASGRNFSNKQISKQIDLKKGESLSVESLMRYDLKNRNNARLKLLVSNIVGTLKIEEDSHEDPTKAKFILAHELLDKLCEITTNKKGIFRSNYFGRKDLGYAKDGPGAYNGLTHGFWVRGFDKLPTPTETVINPFKPLTTSLKDCLASFSAIHNTGFGIEKVGYKEIAVVEDLKYFYNRNVTIRLPNQVKKMKRSVATEYYYSSVEMGYEKGGNYEEAMGLDEYNVKSTFTTAITRLKNVYVKISKYRADSYGREFARRKQKSLGDTIDTPYDNDVFIMDLKPTVNGSFEERKYADDFDKKPSGVHSPETATNLRLSPLNMMFRHGWVVATGLIKYSSEYLRYASSKSNSNLKTKLKGKNEYAENGNIVNSEIEKARFVPEYVEFEHVVDFEIMQQIEGKSRILGTEINNVYGLIEYRNEKNEFEKGWLMNLKPNDKKWKVLKANT
jgi:hypothetical protein